MKTSISLIMSLYIRTKDKVFRIVLQAAIIFLWPIIFPFAQTYIEWERNFGGSQDEEALDIIDAGDGGFYVAGFTESTDGNITNSYGGKDAWLIKIDSLGFLEWEKSYGGSGDDVFTAMVRDQDGNLIIAGSTTSEEFPNHVESVDIWVVKLDDSGGIIWDTTYGGSQVDEAVDIISVHDTAFAILAETDSRGWVADENPQTDILVLNIDTEGNINWKFPYDMDPAEDKNSIEKAGAITLTQSGDFLICGSTAFHMSPNQSNDDDDDLLVMKVRYEGDSLEWIETFGGSSHDQGANLFEKDNGDIIVFGTTQSSDGDVANKDSCSISPTSKCYDGWIVKLDAQGRLRDTNVVIGNEVAYDRLVNGVETGDREILAIGMATIHNPVKQGEFWVIKMNEDLEVVRMENFGSKANDYAKAFTFINDNTIVMAGGSTLGDEDVSTNFGGNDFWIVKVSNKCTTRPQTPSENLLDFFCESDGIELEYGIDLYDSYYFNNHNRTFSSNVPLISADISTSRLKGFHSSFYQEKDGCFSRGLYLEFPFPLAVNDTFFLDVLAPPEELLPLANDVILRNGTDLSIITDSGIGKAYVSNDSTIIYEPSPYSLAVDSFEYQICDSPCLHLCDTAKALILRTDELNVYEAPDQIGFTPNGDGVNDLLPLNFLNPDKQNELIIFNRWGQVVFESRFYEDDWGGRWKGKLLPPGPYYFTLKSKEDGSVFNGVINLLY